MSSELAEQQAGQVPALVETPALEIEGEDVALPRLYLGQFMSAHVQEKRVPAGSIFTATGEDDQDPQILWQLYEPDADEEALVSLYNDQPEDGVLVHIVAMRKGKSLSEDGELQLYAFNDPEAPPEAWTTYNYVVALPEADQDLPYKWLLTRTGTAAAKNINLVLRKNASRGPAWNTAFRATAAFRQNDKGKFFVPRIHAVDADEANVELAASFVTMLSSDAADAEATGEEPGI